MSQYVGVCHRGDGRKVNLKAKYPETWTGHRSMLCANQIPWKLDREQEHAMRKWLLHWS